MLRRPLLVWLIGIGLILAPLYYYFEAAVNAALPLSDPGAVLSTIPFVKIGSALLGPPVGALVLQVRRTSWYAIVGYASYALLANTMLLATGRVRPTLFGVFVPTGLLCLLYFARSEIMSPFFNPRLRGWESDRVRFRAPVTIDLAGESLAAQLWDISPSGAYLEIDRALAEGTWVDCAFELDATTPLRLRARAVWSSAGDAERPRGVGVEFDDPSARAIAASLERVLRRTAPRLPFKLRVDIEGHDGIDCESFDMSRAGCFLVADAQVEVGQRLKMTLHLGEPLAVEGEVVRVRLQAPRGFGVRFARTPRRLRAALRDFHAQRAEVAPKA